MSAALELLASLVIADGRRWAEACTDVQLADARAVLDVDNAQRRHWISRSRGYAKTDDAGGWSLAVLDAQAPAGSRSYAGAASQEQAGLLLDSIAGFVDRSGLHDVFEVQTQRVLHRLNAASLVVLSSDSHSAWGLRPYWTVIDEICQHKDTRGARQFYDAISTGWAKVPGARAAVITTSGDPAHWSRKIYDTAVAESDLWRVSETHGPAPWMEQRLLDAERRRLTDSQFARLFDNRWTAGEDRLVDAETLRECVAHDGPLEPVAGERYAVGLDLGLKKDRSVLSVAHVDRAQRRIVLDRQEVWSGTRGRPVDLDAVEAYCLEVHRRYHGPPFIFDPWQAAQLMGRLKRKGVRVIEHPFTAQSVGRLAQRLYLLLREREIALPADEDLLDELLNIRLRESSPGVFRLDHDAGRHDDRAVSLGLVAQHLAERLVTSPGKATFPTGRLPTQPIRQRSSGALLTPDAVRGSGGTASHQWRPGDPNLPRVGGRK